jgi:predicted transposase YbfD/YdcC
MKELKEYLGQVRDPRIDRRKLHLLEDIVLLVLVAVICGCESWETIEEFGKNKKDFLRKYLTLTNGIPSHDTIERLFKRMDNIVFSEVLMRWSNLLREKGFEDIISVDGKTLRGSKDESNGKYAIHLVSAWCNKNRLVLGQVKTACKTNEIEAVKELLHLLDIEGAVITADAMSCQKEIVRQIVEQKADYIIAIKDNQKNLKQNIEFEFKTQADIATHQWTEKDHGRIETRTCQVINNLNELEEKENWAALTSIVKITSYRDIKGILTQEVRFYISSKLQTASYFNKAVRTHWGIENTLHWRLDVQFNEDKSRKRKDNAAENFATIRRLALSKLTSTPFKRQGINNRRLIASWNENYLIEVLKN